MTRAKYIADTNELQELSSMEKPDQYSFSHKFAYEDAMAAYNNHLASLRSIPCDPSCREVFKGNQEYEEGRDYEIKEVTVPADHWQDVPTKRLRAFPITVKTEDELWREALDTLVGAGHYAVRANHVIEELKKHYTLIKK